MQLLLGNLRANILAIVFTLLLSVSFIALVPAASAQIPDAAKNAACQGVGEAGGSEQTSGCDGEAGESIRGLLRKVINVLSWVVGIIAIIMIIIGGLKYVTSNGDSNGINSAKHTIIYALVGVAVAVLAQVLVRFVLQSVGGAASDS